MCGIIAVLRRQSQRAVPEAPAVIARVEQAVEVLEQLGEVPDPDSVAAAAEHLAAADELLRGEAGALAMLADPGLAPALRAQLDRAGRVVAGIEARLDQGLLVLGDGGLEAFNAALVAVKDAAWAIGADRLRTAGAVAELLGQRRAGSAVRAALSIQQALSALDRLEVRGRDSAGLVVFVTSHGLDTSAPTVSSLLDSRVADELFTTGAVRAEGDVLAFVYKAAAEIGELGDNTRELRKAVVADELLWRALEGEAAEATVLGHTRWASVGIISQPNAHPLDSAELEPTSGPLVAAVLNGDVDNFADLKVTEGLRIAPEITTDAKVIPTLISRHQGGGSSLVDAFRLSVAALDGSVAIAALSASDPERICLALRGSGQSLYVGLAEDAFIVASEPYGVIEEARAYLRMDGETPADPAEPITSRGQVVVIERSLAGELEGIERQSYNGMTLPVRATQLATAEITTRDIDRGDHPHFLLKEISEAPASFKATLRGKLVAEPGGLLGVVLPDSTLPEAVRSDLREGRVDRVVVIGQGTAAVAGSSLAAVLADLVRGSGTTVESTAATELSGFGLEQDMSGVLVIAISQSGTTTDTNRTVDLVRSRGARVVAIVNRRASDLCDKSDGVLFTSDGRDIEMSVASTKAFYAQVAAGFLLAVAIAQLLGVDVGRPAVQELLGALRDLPDAMQATLGQRPAIAAAAHQVARSRRSWAVVGNGRNLIAARELRIKLSELCYKSIACDSTEDKKHIDLSAEPMILVCAVGLVGSTADDVAKEVAIYRAHKAAPVVITGEREARYGAALHVITVPSVHPQLGFVLAAMAGHLFGYEAALAIDAQARPLREARAAIERSVSAAVDGETAVAVLAPQLEPLASRYFDGIRAGEYNGHLEPSTAVRVATLLRYALGVAPLESYELELGKVGTPAVVIEDLTEALTRAIEELTRPIDAIKHQAKTVTVGISRSDESLLEVPLVRAVLDAGAGRDRLSYSTLRVLADLDRAVLEVLGFTRYAIEGDVTEDASGATITVIDRGGIARDIPSRIDREPLLRGTKHQVALERRVFVNVGRSDGRTVVIVPELKGNHTTGITLLHVRFAEQLGSDAARTVLAGYRGRYAALRDAVMETEPAFRDDLLAEIPVLDLLTSPIQALADRWRADRAER